MTEISYSSWGQMFCDYIGLLSVYILQLLCCWRRYNWGFRGEFHILILLSHFGVRFRLKVILFVHWLAKLTTWPLIPVVWLSLNFELGVWPCFCLFYYTCHLMAKKQDKKKSKAMCVFLRLFLLRLSLPSFPPCSGKCSCSSFSLVLYLLHWGQCNVLVWGRDLIG